MLIVFDEIKYLTGGWVSEAQNTYLAQEKISLVLSDPKVPLFLVCT